MRVIERRMQLWIAIDISSANVYDFEAIIDGMEISNWAPDIQLKTAISP